MQTRKNWIGRSMRFVACTLTLLVCQASLEGAQIASNFAGSDLGDWFIGENGWSAVQFHTNGAPWLATDIRVPIGLHSSDYPEVGIYLRIYTDVADNPGSPVGGKFHTDTIDSVNTIKTFTDESLGSTHLDPNTDYWVVFAVEPTFAANPHFSRTTLAPGAGPGSVLLGMRFSSNYGGSWSVAPAAGPTSALRMEINGVQIGVPEPSSAVLAAFGLVGLAAWGWRRKRRV